MNKDKTLRLEHGPAFDIACRLREERDKIEARKQELQEEYQSLDHQFDLLQDQLGREAAIHLGIPVGTQLAFNLHYLNDHGVVFVHIGSGVGGGQSSGH